MKGIVIIDNEDYGKSMELVHCLKDAACKLAEHLGRARMEEAEPYREYEQHQHYQRGMGYHGNVVDMYPNDRNRDYYQPHKPMTNRYNY